MDTVDKTILRALRVNCRVSYQSLANELDLSLNAVKTRVNKLVESGVIVQFGVWLDYSVIDAGFAFIEIELDGNQDEEFLESTITESPMTMSFGFNSSRGGLVRVEYQRMEMLSEYGSFLRKLPGIKAVDIHPIQTRPSNPYEFSKMELKVLRCLKDDPRMPVRTIANRIGSSSKRISTILQRFNDDNLIQFSIDWNLNAGGSTSFMLRFEYNDKMGGFKDLDELIRQKYDHEYWGSMKSSLQPLALAFFVVDHIRDAEDIAKELRNLEMINDMETIVPFLERKLPGLCGNQLDMLIAGIDC